VVEAAELKALTELARGNYLRSAEGNLDDVVRIERAAAAAVRAIGLPPEKGPKPPTLAERLGMPQQNPTSVAGILARQDGSR
jgi:hypothetical protein